MTHKAPAERRKNFLDRHPEWRSRTLSQFLSEAAGMYPGRPFVITPGRTYTYDDIKQWSRRLARGLIALGVEAGDHMAIVMANHPEFVALKFAISSVGAVAVPLNFLFRKEEMRYVIQQSDCTALVIMERFRDLDYLDMLDAMAPGWESGDGGTAFPKLRQIVTFNPEGKTRPSATGLADLEAAAEQVDDSAVTARESGALPDGVVYIVYTSGTTGFPKGAMLTHDSVLTAAYSSVLIRALDDGHKTLFALPLYHVFSYIEGLLAVMWVGGAIIPQLAFDPVDTFKAIQEYGADEALLVPTMTIALVEHPERGNYDLHTLRTVMSAAAPAPVRVWELVRQELGVAEIITAYGQTETSASTTYTLPDDSLELVASTVGRAKPRPRRRPGSRRGSGAWAAGHPLQDRGSDYRRSPAGRAGRRTGVTGAGSHARLLQPARRNRQGSDQGRLDALRRPGQDTPGRLPGIDRAQ